MKAIILPGKTIFQKKKKLSIADLFVLESNIHINIVPMGANFVLFDQNFILNYYLHILSNQPDIHVDSLKCIR